MPELPDSPADTNADSLVDDDLLPASLWRRPALIAASLSLLGLGVFVNADRLGLADERSFVNATPEEEESPEDEVDAGGVAHRHTGEEGKMGRPRSKSKSGTYALKGPKSATPQMARNFDPEMAAKSAGILGQLAQESGHFLSSPSAAAVGIGTAGLVGTGRGGGGTGNGTIGLGNVGLIGKGGGSGSGYGYGRGSGFRGGDGTAGDTYASNDTPNGFVVTADDPKSTFSIDVDTASYANVRRFVTRDRRLPPAGAVRTEELINYFDYAYATPAGDVPFSITAEVGPSPWSGTRRLVHVGLQGKRPASQETPPRNLVFLLDVSGSMSAGDRLPLVVAGLSALTEQLRAEDRITVVTYAGSSAEALPPTSGADKERIRRALANLQGGGGTNGAAGIMTAYERAQANFVEGGINRVILATDGDFNVGVSDRESLVELIEHKRKSGVFLSVLGVGRGNLRDATMEQLADKGNGNYAYLDGELEARKVLVDQAGATLDTIAKDVKIQVEFDPAQVAEHRLVGYENRVLAHKDFDDDAKDAGEIGAGHTVTALYEVVPAKGAETGDGMMRLSLRYKKPNGSKSRRIDLAVGDEGRALDETSEAFRFSAAVAAFGERLRGVPMGDEFGFFETMALASAAVGDDPHCYRHGFLEVVHAAAMLAGEEVYAPERACVPDDAEAPPTVEPPARPTIETETVEPEDETSREDETSQPEAQLEATPEPTEAPFDWSAFVLNVLRLLPPLLALPLFVLAFRRPRRRTRRQ
ncbi:MAG: von Willebrand factor type A domain-containing protein [Myxococcota bacterium]